MQDECDEIYSAVLHNTMQGIAARRQLNEADTTFMTVIHGPQRQVKNSKYNLVLYTNSIHCKPIQVESG